MGGIGRPFPRAHDRRSRLGRYGGTLALVALSLITVSLAALGGGQGGFLTEPTDPTSPVPATGWGEDETGETEVRGSTLETWTLGVHHPVNQPRPDPDPVPSAEQGIGPGSELAIEFPDDSDTSCTANFVWEDQHGQIYLGTAGHCILRDGQNATHGPNADTTVEGVEVDVAVANCELKPSTFVAEGRGCVEEGDPEWGSLGDVVYANQRHTVDFALVKIPAELRDHVRTDIPSWGAFDGEGTDAQGREVAYYGHGWGYAASPSTRARSGTSIGGYPNDVNDSLFAFVGPAYGGDSGSAVVTLSEDPAGRRSADGALGVLTAGVGIGGPSPVSLYYGPRVATIESSVLCNTGLEIRVLPGGNAATECTRGNEASEPVCPPGASEGTPELLHLLAPPLACPTMPQDGGWAMEKATSSPMLSDDGTTWTRELNESTSVQTVDGTVWIRVKEHTAYTDIPVLRPFGAMPFSLGIYVNGEWIDTVDTNPGTDGAPGVLEPGTYELDFPPVELARQLDAGDELMVEFRPRTSSTSVSPTFELIGGTPEHDSRLALIHS